MRDRIELLSKITNSYENIDNVINGHYFKFVYLHDIILEECISDKDDIVNIEGKSINDSLFIVTIKFKNKKIMKTLSKEISAHIINSNNDINAKLENISDTEVNISITTRFIEEDKYDNRPDTNSKVYSSKQIIGGN